MNPSKDVLKDILSIPSCSGHEGMLRDYILAFANGRGITSTVDRRGNVYLSKGTLAPGELYPCLVNHLDTVHSDQAAMAESGKRLKILESVSEDGKTVLRADGTGIGADDKLGCALALAILDDRAACRAAFFVEEERGMLGSKEMDVEWFREVSFVLSFDSPGRNRSSRSCSGRTLFTEAFFERYLRDVCFANGVTAFNDEPFTDVVQIRDKTDLMCFNVGNGGYRAHCPDEYLVVEDAQAAYRLGTDLLNAIGMAFRMRMPRRP